MLLLTVVSLMLTMQTSVLDFATAQWRTDSEVRIEDAYKWLYQAPLGGEYAAPSEAEARRWLAAEWSDLSAPQAGEPVWQPLRADGKIGRLNLRPFRAADGKMDDLLRAFPESARSFKGEGTQFEVFWKALGAHLKEHSSGNLNYDKWRRLDERMRAANYPAIHHSQMYEMSRRPAYRVLTREAAEKLIAELPHRSD